MVLRHITYNNLKIKIMKETTKFILVMVILIMLVFLGGVITQRSISNSKPSIEEIKYHDHKYLIWRTSEGTQILHDAACECFYD